MKCGEADFQALPLAVGALCGSVAATCSGTLVAMVTICAAVLFMLLFARSRHMVILCLVAMGAVIAAVLNLRPAKLPDTYFAGTEFAVSGTVLGTSEMDNGQRVLASANIEGVGQTVRLRLIVTDIAAGLAVGDQFSMRAAFDAPNRYEDVPGMDMQEIGQRADRVSAVAIVSSEQIERTGHVGGIASFFDGMRQSMVRAVYGSGLDQRTASLLTSSLLGTSDALPEVKEQFRATGLSHLLCVSGFHVAVLCGIIAFLLRPLRLLRRGLVVENILLLLAVWFYAALTGLAPSALRAAIMISCFIQSRLLQRDASAFNSLAVSVGVMLFVNPWWVYAPGFQLSVAAVAGILVFAGKFNLVPVKHLALRRLADLAVIPFAASIATAPILLALFHRLPLLTVPVNAFASLFFPLFMFAGGVYVLLSSVGLHIPLLGNAVEWMSDTISRLCASFSGYEITELHLAPATLLVLVFAIMLLAAVLVLPCRRHKIEASLAMVALAVFGTCSNSPVSPSRALVDLHRYGPTICVAKGSHGSVYTDRSADRVLGLYQHYFAAHGISLDSISIMPMPPDGRIHGLPTIPPDLILPRAFVYNLNLEGAQP